MFEAVIYYSLNVCTDNVIILRVQMKGQDQSFDEQQASFESQNSQQPVYNQQNHKQDLGDYQAMLSTKVKSKVRSSIEQLMNDDIEYNPYRDHNTFQLTLLHYSSNFKTITLHVNLGPFSTIINIFKQTQKSLIHNENCLYGAFGNVYLLQWGCNEQIAIKCIKIKCDQSKQSFMLQGIKQYMVNRIASAIKVGPKIIKIQQFDIVTYQDCLQFSMQKCYLQQQYPFQDEDYEQLKLNLRKLHEIKIVHCDIKAQNLVYSKYFRCPVFLDFGFSKILSTGPGIAVLTKFVGSLSNCSKKMSELYVSKCIGMVDLYYNDAYCLCKVMKSENDGGRNLKEIVNFYDPQSQTFQNTKIIYNLYYDKLFVAKSEYVKCDRTDKNIKIIRYMKQLSPTENLRDFYYQFLESEWNESYDCYHISKAYRYSHLNPLHHQMEDRQIDQRQSRVDQLWLNQILNHKINLFKLDNDMIDYTNKCIGYQDFVQNNYGREEQYDFFMDHVGVLKPPHIFNINQQQLIWEISHLFYARIPDSKDNSSRQNQLYSCYKHLADYSVQLPINQWKIDNSLRIFSELMAIKHVQYEVFQQYLLKIINISSHQLSIEKRMYFIISLEQALIYQICIWGGLFVQSIQRQKVNIKQFLKKIQTHFYRLISQNESYEKLLKCDLFLLKCLINSQNSNDLIEAIQTSISKFRKDQSTRRYPILNFIKIKYYYQKRLFEQCHREILEAIPAWQIPIRMKPLYFVLCNVYFQLRNKSKCQKILRMLDSILIIRQMVHQNANIRYMYSCNEMNNYAMERIQDYKQYIYIGCMIQRLLKSNYKVRQEQAYIYESLYHITKDPFLIISLQRLANQINTTNKILFYKRLFQYYQNCMIKYEKQQQDRIKQYYVTKLQLEIKWMSNEYSQITNSVIQAKGSSRTQTLELDPQQFDYSVRAYLLLGNMKKVKTMMKWIHQFHYKRQGFLSTWLLKPSFIIFFEQMIDNGDWNEFRMFLLKLIHFIDVNSNRMYLNSYIQCIRYFFNQKVDLTLVDDGLQTIVFPNYQWKYSLVAFFHIQALAKMANLPQYLHIKQLRIFLWRIAKFIPYLRKVEAKWVFQLYLGLSLRLNPKEKYQSYLFRRWRFLANVYAKFNRWQYYLVYLRTVECQKLINTILCKYVNISECVKEQKSVKLSSFNGKNIFTICCKKKLRLYHKNSRNNSLRQIKQNYFELLRLKVEEKDQISNKTFENSEC